MPLPPEPTMPAPAQLPITPPPVVADLPAELAALAALPLADLRTRWTTLTGKPVPRVRRTLLHLALAFELQAAAYGGVPRRTAQRPGAPCRAR